MSQTQIIEIGGVKLEVDMRHAKRIDTFKIGTRVKVLVKPSYSGGTVNIYSGVIVGFEDFKSAPTIVVAYVESGYNADIKFININVYTNQNENGDKYEIVADQDKAMMVSKKDVLDSFNRQIRGKLEEIRELGRKKRMFVSRFGHIFGELREEIQEQLLADRADEDALLKQALGEGETNE